jgi:hypothetical protein
MNIYKNKETEAIAQNTEEWLVERSFTLQAKIDDSHLDNTMREILSALMDNQKCDGIAFHCIEFSTIRFKENIDKRVSDDKPRYWSELNS